MKYLFIFIFCINFLNADIEHFLKKIPANKSCKTIKKIDFIYMINLDQRPEKFREAYSNLKKFGIESYRFSAVNGWELPLDKLNTLGIRIENGMRRDIKGTCYFPEKKGSPFHEMSLKNGQYYFSHCMSRGAIGIVLSHLSILKDALDSGYEAVWILEDDVEVVRDPKVLSSLIKKIDKKVGYKNWDILFTDKDTRDNTGKYIPCLGYARRPNFSPHNTSRFKYKKSISRDFEKVGARYGAYSYIIRRSGMKKIYNFIKKYKIFLPYDMEFYLPNDMNLFCVKKDIINSKLKAFSDNGGPNYLKKKK